MKKKVAILMAAMMGLSSLVGCGGANSSQAQVGGGSKCSFDGVGTL